MATLQFDDNVTTPSGTPLGGWVHVEVSDNGDYYVHFHMHSSSVFGSFDFNLRGYLTAAGFPTTAFVQSGHVSGVDDWDHEERGNNPLLSVYWSQLKTAADAGKPFSVAKDYQWSGVVGTLDDLVKDMFEIGGAAIGATLGVVIGATREAISWLGATLGPGGTLGVVGGVVVFALATVAGAGIGGALILGVVTGVAVGAVTNAMIKYRSLNDVEVALARQVFGDTIPYDKVIITNLGGLGGRAFTAPGVDGKTYCNLGTGPGGYDNPLGPGNGAYPYPGQMLIHELTHAWQIAHDTFLPGLMCSGMFNQAQYVLGDNVYVYGAPGPDWSSFNAEQQGAIVDQWFGGNRLTSSTRPMDQVSTYYRYIWNDILGRNAPFFAPGNLPASASTGVSSVARNANQMDLFWVGQDGAIGSQWWNAAPGLNWGEHAPFALTPPGAGQPGAPATVVARKPDQMDVFWVGADGAIGSQWWNAARGMNWGDHAPFAITPPGAAPLGASVAAVARTPNQMDVFWVGPDGAIGTQWWNAAQGMNWGDHAPFAITPPGAAHPGSPITAIARTSDQLDVFWVQPDGAIASQWWNAAPGSNWSDHGPFTITPPGAARLGSPIVAVARTPDQMDVFWVGQDGAIGSQWWNAAQGMNWGDHAPFAITPPGAAARGSGLTVVARTPENLDLFWVGQDGAIGSQWWSGASGANWNEHAPFAITPPGAAGPGSPITVIARMPNQMDVFWVGRDGAIGSQWWNSAPGMNWGDHAPFPITPPAATEHSQPARMEAAGAVVGRYPNHLDVFWTGPDGAIGSQWWDAAAGSNWGDHHWFPITAAGQAPPAAPVAAVARNPNHLDVFWTRGDGAIGSQWWDAAPHCDWVNHAPFTITPAGAALPGSPVTVVARTADHLDVFWVGADGAIASQWWDAAPHCNWGDHTPFTIAPPGSAHPGSPIVAIARTSDQMDVFWVQPDGAIASQWWNAAPGSNWSDHARFTITPPGAARPGSAITVVARTPDNLDVFWVRPDGAIGSQWWDSATGFNWGDHAPITITPPNAADPNSGLAAVAHYQNHMDVFWTGPDGAMASQWWDAAPRASWGDHAPFPITPPAAARPRSQVSAIGRYPNHLDVFWVGRDGAIGSQWWDAAPHSGWGDHSPFAITPPGVAAASAGAQPRGPVPVVGQNRQLGG